MKYKSLIIATILLCSSPALAQDYAAIAEKGCECMGPANDRLQEMMPVIQNAMKTGDMTNVMTLQAEMMELMGAVEMCFDKLAEEHPRVAQDAQAKKAVQDIMDKECPPPEMGMPGMTQ